MRAVLMLAVALAACRFDAGERATHFRCEGTSDCPADLVCRGGWCEVEAAPMPDAAAPDAASFGCPCSLWDDTALPATLENNDGGSIEVGIKFRADVAGRVIAVRFYKPPLADGVHIAHLWTRDGGLLAEAQYRDETASGWQAVAFDSPVTVQPETTYIASVYVDSGFYAADVDYFVTAWERPPLRGLADGAEGGNGVFSPGEGFPDVTFMSVNYWVDVVFDDG